MWIQDLAKDQVKGLTARLILLLVDKIGLQDLCKGLCIFSQVVQGHASYRTTLAGTRCLGVERDTRPHPLWRFTYLDHDSQTHFKRVNSIER